MYDELISNYNHIYRTKNELDVFADGKLCDQDLFDVREFIEIKCKHWAMKPDCIIVQTKDGYLDVAPWYKNKYKFERVRRITGYLVGTLDRFNDAKLSEVEHRVKHSV